MARPSMRSAAIVQNLNLLDCDYRRVSPAFIEGFFTGNNDAETFVTAEVQIGRVRVEVIDCPMIVGADEFVFGRGLDAERASNNPFALNNALGWRLLFGNRSRVGCCCGRFGGRWHWLGSWRRRGGRRCSRCRVSWSSV